MMVYYKCPGCGRESTEPIKFYLQLGSSDVKCPECEINVSDVKCLIFPKGYLPIGEGDP
jgi:DNA-directed RNA polymerase subunit RPC12/RpoP